MQWIAKTHKLVQTKNEGITYSQLKLGIADLSKMEMLDRSFKQLLKIVCTYHWHNELKRCCKNEAVYKESTV